jgi:hypothetical protein
MSASQLFTLTYRTLLNAFPVRTELELMVKLGLHENLNTITQGNSLSDDVFRLVQWVESRGRLNELIQAAHDYNPTFAALRSLVEQIGGQPVAVSPTPSPPSPMIDRFDLSLALENQLDSDQLDILISDLRAGNSVPAVAAMNVKVNKLLSWSETVAGPGLDGVLQVVKRRYPNFRFP